MRRKRIGVAIAVGAAFGVLTYALLRARGPSIQGADFTYPWLAARAILHRQNPYDVISPVDVPFGGRFLYPWTASIVAVPFAWLDSAVGGALMAAITVGLAVFAVTREHWWRLLMFVSGPAYMIVSSVQWSGLLVAASEFPALIGIAGAIKPFAIASLAYQRRRRDVLRAVAVGVPILALSLILAPRWPLDWLHTMQASPPGHQYETPLLRWTGLPVVLALTRWRRPEARLLFCMAALPQTMFLYDQVLVFLIPRSRVEMLVAVVLSLLVLLLPAIIFDQSTSTSLSRAYVPLMNCGIYWPALVMVLRRPNVV
jgi:hypothetical protein